MTDLEEDILFQQLVLIIVINQARTNISLNIVMKLYQLEHIPSFWILI
jgi:hypothetical protein